MWENLEHLAHGKGVFVFLPLMFVAVGVLAWTSTLIDLFTGGRRLSPLSKPLPGDRLFFLLNFVGITGWLGFALVFFLDTLCGADHRFGSEALISLSWAMGAFGFGGINVFRYDMMLARWREGAQSATGLRRWFYGRAWQSQQKRGRINTGMARVAGVVFLLIGAGTIGGMVVMGPKVGPEIGREIDQIVTALQTGQTVAARANPV